MKKIFITILIVALSFNLIACAKKDGGSGDQPNESTQNPILEKTPEEIIAYLYENAEPTSTLESVSSWAEIVDITQENASWFLGSSEVPFDSASASESPISPSNYSLVVVKVKEDATVEDAKKLIEDNLKPNKWVCMGAEDMIVESVDRVILAVLADADTLTSLKDAFLALK